MRRQIEEIFLRSIRFYTRRSPIQKGKYRLFSTALGLCREHHASLDITLPDSRCFKVRLTPFMQDSVFFMDQYEPFLSTIISELTGSGDVCIDVGANFGWYTSLFALRCGPTGSVHAFEPLASTFADLKRNYEVWGRPGNVTINELALGRTEGRASIFAFDGKPIGHASLKSDPANASSEFDCVVTTLDDYLRSSSISTVDILKVDIEGAELDFLQGASSLFRSPEHLPIMLIEMARATSVRFGYTPNDLVTKIRELGEYDFYAADEIDRRLRPITGFAPEDIGANVFCIPKRIEPEKAAIVSRYLNRNK